MVPAWPGQEARPIETVLTAWSTWRGGFVAFCEHVQLHLRVPLARNAIQHVLEAHGVRIPKRRGRPPDGCDP